eukprot:PhM_4_TR16523/c0_g1_i1/m.40675
MADDEDDERVSVPPPPHAARIERFIDDMPGPDELAPVGDHRRRRASSSYLLYQKSQEQAVSKQGFSTAAALQRTTSNISWRILDFYAAQHKQSIEERKLHALERKAQRKAKKEGRSGYGDEVCLDTAESSNRQKGTRVRAAAL